LNIEVVLDPIQVHENLAHKSELLAEVLKLGIESAHSFDRIELAHFRLIVQLQKDVRATLHIKVQIIELLELRFLFKQELTAN